LSLFVDWKLNFCFEISHQRFWTITDWRTKLWNDIEDHLKMEWEWSEIIKSKHWRNENANDEIWKTKGLNEREWTFSLLKFVNCFVERSFVNEILKWNGNEVESNRLFCQILKSKFFCSSEKTRNWQWFKSKCF
jgi:hypothetical protein